MMDNIPKTRRVVMEYTHGLMVEVNYYS
jgi:hypothetical protein